MSAAETIELAITIGNRIDVQWGLFVTVHLALLGALAYINEPLHRVEKAIALIVYLGFAWINYTQMNSQLALLNAAYIDVHRLALAGDTSAMVERIAMQHEAGNFRLAKIAVNVSHGLMLVLVVVAVIVHPLVARKADD